MSKVVAEISISLDGFVAGPNLTVENPLGEGGERLHEWGVATRAWREHHDMEGGEESVDSRIIAEATAASGATIMGRRMFSGGEGPWENDPRKDGWWGDNPPFHHPVFVLTHHPREPLEMKGGTTFTFVDTGIEEALGLAKEAAGGLDVKIAGGGSAIQQYIAAGLADELQLHLVPTLLGSGISLFDGLEPDSVGFELEQAVDSPHVTHLFYRLNR